MTHAWLLNLDAERELAHPLGYTTPGALASQMRGQHALVAALCAGQPVIPLDATKRPRDLPKDCIVLPWCPTPSALARIGRLGLRTPAAPPLSVLQRVNHRRFQHELARSLPAHSATPLLQATEFIEPVPGGGTQNQAAQLADRLDAGLARGRRYRLERSYGFTGKGARRFLRRIDTDDRRWLRQALDSGGVLVEPFLDVETELSLHGWVGAEGALIGAPCTQTCDPTGAPVAVHVIADPLPRGVARPSALEALQQTATRVAAALADAGYFGPFGIDALVGGHEGTLALHPLSDLNARFTMGWSIGMGPLRQVALGRAERG